MEDIAEIKAELGLTDGWIRYNATNNGLSYHYQLQKILPPN